MTACECATRSQIAALFFFDLDEADVTFLHAGVGLSEEEEDAEQLDCDKLLSVFEASQLSLEPQKECNLHLPL